MPISFQKIQQLLFFFALLITLNVSGQTDPSRLPAHCGFGPMRTLRGFDTIPEPKSKQNETFFDSGEVYVVPVVVHVIHNGGPENISDAVVRSQIDVLNEDFGRYGAGSNNNDLSMDARIRFCLATKDPDGKATTGIVRIKSSFTDLDDANEMLAKNLSRWDQRRYLNIWVVRMIGDDNNTQGYAYLASEGAGKDYDGVVINYRYFGRNAPQNPSNYRAGHTTTHEVGHYFNLLHTWGGDGRGRGGCNDDDGVWDTPDCDGPYFSQRNPLTGVCDRPVQCNSPRLIEDYMDYSEDPCLSLYTKGQVDRMRQAIMQYRPGLVSYGSISATGCGNLYRSVNPPTNELIIGPNPTSGNINLYPNFSTAQTADVMLYDNLGRLVKATTLSLLANQETIETTELRSGVYMLYIRMPDKTYSEKIIVVKKQ